MKQETEIFFYKKKIPFSSFMSDMEHPQPRILYQTPRRLRLLCNIIAIFNSAFFWIEIFNVIFVMY